MLIPYVTSLAQAHTEIENQNEFIKSCKSKMEHGDIVSGVRHVDEWRHHVWSVEACANSNWKVVEAMIGGG